MRRYLIIDEDGQASLWHEVRPPSGNGSAPMLVVDLQRARENFARLAKGRTMFTKRDLANVVGGSKNRIANWLMVGILKPTIHARGAVGDSFSFDEAFITGVAGALTRARQTRGTLKRATAVIRAELSRETEVKDVAETAEAT